MTVIGQLQPFSPFILNGVVTADRGLKVTLFPGQNSCHLRLKLRLQSYLSLMGQAVGSVRLHVGRRGRYLSTTHTRISYYLLHQLQPAGTVDTRAPYLARLFHAARSVVSVTSNMDIHRIQMLEVDPTVRSTVYLSLGKRMV